ncbi:MAG: hypothetical protein GWQ08_21130 [Verrucomicrobiaceae bacterium]|nr:hypothetical protein [Verrucomicrobiaceae bacterium]
MQLRFKEAGKTKQFDTLKPWLVDETENLSQADAADALGSVKVAIHRLRGDFRNAVETEIFNTLPHDDDLADEMRYLNEALSWNPNHG